MLDLAVLEADFTQHRVAQPHDTSTFELRTNPLGIDLRSAIDGDVSLVHDQGAVVLDLDVDHRRHVGHEAVMHRQAQAPALGQLAPPAGSLGGGFQYRSQARGVDRITFG
ncbi:hypothetical protein D3C81_1959160 [compost metagenome]